MGETVIQDSAGVDEEGGLLGDASSASHSAAHGHSHGGQPCHGHGHAHSHGHGHAHSHGHGHSHSSQPSQAHTVMMPVSALRGGPTSTEEIFLLARSGSFDPILGMIEKDSEMVHLRDDSGHTFLHWATLLGDVNIVNAFLAAGAEVDCKAANGQTPLMWASLKGNIPVLNVLVDHGASITSSDSLGAFPLVLAVQHQMLNSFLLLLKLGAPISQVDNNGCTIAHWAAYKGDMATLRYLDYFRADFSLRDNEGMTCLHRAVSAADSAATNWLINRGADFDVKNKQGQTPLDFATAKGNKYMVEVLKKAIARKGKKITADADDIEMQAMPTTMKETAVLMERERKQNAQLRNKAMPLVWLMCCAAAMIAHLTDIRDTGLKYAPTCVMCFEILTPIVVILFAAVLMGNPGRLEPRVQGRSAVEELQEHLLTVRKPSDLNQDITRICYTCWVYKPLRAKHCAICDVCVDDFDHHCMWLNNCVGRGNRRGFIILTILEISAQFFSFYLCWNIIQLRLVDQFQHGFVWSIYFSLTTWSISCFVLFLHTITIPWLFCLIFFQLRSIGKNLSTNEMINLKKYSHFWKSVIVESGGSNISRRVYTNPFDNGYIRNCLAFWLQQTQTD